MVCFSSELRKAATLLILVSSATLALASALRSTQSGAANPNQSPVLWTPAQALQAGDLVRELAQPKDGPPPTILYVGFRTLFEGGHLQGASFHGTASTEKGLAELKKSLEALPRSTNLVIYCGCCPFDRCPNIRPAFTALHDMGFTHIRVLVLPTSFAADWVEKGYPIQKGL